MIEILGKYWSQIALLLGIIGYILRIILKARVKIQEIKFSNLHALRTKEIKEFYLSFLDFEDMLKKYNARAFNNMNLDEKFYLDKDSKFNCFFKNLESLKLIIDDSKSKALSELLKEFQGLDIRISTCINEIRSGRDIDKEEAIQLLNNTYDYLHTSLPTIKSKLEKMLRDINGV